MCWKRILSPVADVGLADACVWAPRGTESRRPSSGAFLLSYFPIFLHSSFPPFLLSYFGRLDNGPIEPVQLPLEATILPPTTILLPYIDGHRLAHGLDSSDGTPRKARCKGTGERTFDVVGASVPVDALQVIAIAAEFARGHAAYVLERCYLVLVGFVEMVVGARVVRAVGS